MYDQHIIDHSRPSIDISRASLKRGTISKNTFFTKEMQKLMLNDCHPTKPSQPATYLYLKKEDITREIFVCYKY